MLTVVNIEPTPNPNAIKFVVNQPFVPSGSVTYGGPAETGVDPLGAALFRIRGVQSVYYMHDFVTVTKSDEVPWEDIVEEAESTISSTAPVIDVPVQPAAAGPAAPAPADAAEFEKLPPDERLAVINRLLDEEIRSYLAGDGGGLQVLGLDGNLLRVHYEGACGSCPTSTAGTLRAIESLLRERLSGNLALVAE
ncbi:MAG: hypothetical protein A3G34_11030 [Candidatus Lindowbacteria bacterium RIFCSPLOWO2_12_FULL_62_27]|nr:MAG: hypothetical protein A3G34_11030 [Candidatus Lindowbacteria bacterium RIFCSPLOWO2_12_FULL_62_27]OGH63432.1 MAG: hypothetical protein A3I06_06590 [Candidatus Lindowbacteria bacterium RIFCSPLOWO2_02_FULL_62_12]